jgi:hypothetical protein
VCYNDAANYNPQSNNTIASCPLEKYHTFAGNPTSTTSQLKTRDSKDSARAWFFLNGFLPTALRAVGLGITLSTFYSFYRDKPRNGHLDILTTQRYSMLLDTTTLLYTTWRFLTLFDAVRRYSTLLDATQRWSTLIDAVRRCSTLLNAARRCPMLLDSVRRYSTLLDATQRCLTIFDAIWRYSTLFDALDATCRYLTLFDATRRYSTNTTQCYPTLNSGISWCNNDLAGRLGRQIWLADLTGRLGRQTWPADLAGRLGRQTWPADLAGRLGRQT